MAKAIVQVTLERKNSLPVDAIVNTYHFESDDAFGVSAPGLHDRLETFYQSLSSWFSSLVTGQASVRMYDYDDPKPRVPKYEDTFSFTPSSSAWPAELAVCLSMEAEAVSGEIKARRRRRVYLGPPAERWPLRSGLDGLRHPAPGRLPHAATLSGGDHGHRRERGVPSGGLQPDHQG